jgi:hypothetical protein
LTCRKASKIVHSHFIRHTKARMWSLCHIRSKIIIQIRAWWTCAW